jgi:alpha-galactosidase
MCNFVRLFAWLTLGLCTGMQMHAGTFSSSTTAPAVNGADIANFAAQSGTDKWFFQTNDEANPSDAAKGQTFITGSTTVKLKSLTYKISSGNLKAAPTTYKVRLGTVSGTSFTQIFTETINQTVNTASGAFMTWTLGTPVTLQPNTTYGIDVAMDSGVSFTTGIPYLSVSDHVTNARIGSLYDSGDMGMGNATITLTTAEDRVFHLDLEDPQNPTPDDGSTVPAGNVVLGWTNLPPTTGTNVWVDMWYGTNAAAMTKVVSASQNLTTHTVSAPTGATYYWRIDSYLNGAPTGTPVTGTRFSFLVTDTDGDGLPDAFELLHTTPASTTSLNPGDDLDSDGLTNLQEHTRGTLPRDSDTDNDTLLDGPELTGVGSRPATDPKKADTDGDSVNDGAESNTGIWVSSTDRGTNPTKTDTDGDGLGDGVETNSGTYVSESNTGTNPLLKNSDGDNAEDWYEVAASYTNPTSSTSKPNIPYPLPDPDSSTGTDTKPVKVFILSGQSNMVGFGRVAGTENDTLQSLTQTEKKFPNLITSTNAWTVRQDVLYRGVISALGEAPIAPGFGESSDSFGPELGFGHAIGYIHDEPVLIIKTSIGNRSLGWDYLPPGSARYSYGGVTYAGYGDYVKQPGGTTVPANWYAGKQYDDGFLHENDMGAKAWASGLAYVIGSQVKHGGKTFVSKTNHTSAAGNAPPASGSNTNWNAYSVFNVCDILDNFATEYPQWATRGFQIAGIGWFQGWNDGQSSDTEYAVRYEQNLVRFIKQLRLYYNARYPTQTTPTIPFVTVTCGFDGFAAAGNRLTVVNAQNAVGDPVKYPEFDGNVKSMEGRGYWRTSGPNMAQNYHYYHNAETYMLVGDAMGRGMIDLLASSSSASQLTALTISTGTLSPAFVGDTLAYSATTSAPSITVTPTLVGAAITVNGNTVASGAASSAIPLSIGANTITIASTASGSTSTYTLTITRTQNTYTWSTNVAGPSSWSTAANWTPGTGFPNGTDDLANLTNNITANNQIALAAPITVGGLSIGDSSGDNAFLINAGHSITLDVTTGSATLTRIATGTSVDTISTAIILADPLAASVSTNTGSLTLSGAISETGGAKSFTKSGAGVLNLGGTNTYTGGTVISNGTLILNTAASLGGGPLTLGNNTNNPYLNNASGGPITFTNNMTWAGNYRLGGNWTFSNIALTANATKEIYGTVTVGGVVSGAFAITKHGTGTLVFNGLNTYTGQTILRQGTLTINTLKSYGVASSLGAPTTGNIVLSASNSSVLSYTGTGDTTNRPIQVGGTTTGAATATLANNGTGPLIFTAAAFNTPVAMTSGLARNLLLSGTFGNTTTPNEIQGVLADNTLNGAPALSNYVNLSKNGTGAWKLSGANTYSGNTTISAGTFILGANNVLPDTTAVSIGAATLDADTRTDTAGTLNITAAATISLGTGAALAFADSSAVTWAGTLNITGTFVSGTSLRFGTTSTALTPTQLSRISSAGFTSFSLNSSGYLIGSTAPTYATWQTANSSAGAFTADHDNDGVTNGIEYFLGGSSNTTGQSSLPGVTNTSGTLSITWTKSATYPGTYGTNFWIESSETLTGTWTIEILGGNVIQTGNNITYTFPAGGTRRFVRLKVVGP